MRVRCEETNISGTFMHNIHTAQYAILRDTPNRAQRLLLLLLLFGSGSAGGDHRSY